MESNVIDVKSLVEFSPLRIIKKDLIDVEKFNIALICLESDQEIPPHPENYDAVFYVLGGEGVFTIGEEKLKLKEGSMVFSPKEKVRGIKSLEKLSILGIREGLARE